MLGHSSVNMTKKYARVVDDLISRDKRKRWGSMGRRLQIKEERLPGRRPYYFLLKSGVANFGQLGNSYGK
jgi:hypothetical protein